MVPNFSEQEYYIRLDGSCYADLLSCFNRFVLNVLRSFVVVPAASFSMTVTKDSSLKRKKRMDRRVEGDNQP